MKKLISCILIYSLTISYSLEGKDKINTNVINNSKEYIVIRGQLRKNGDVFRFFYQDKFNDLTVISKYKKIRDINYTVIQSNEPLLIYHGWKFDLWPFLAIPGDTITIKISQNGYYYSSAKYGASANILNEVNKKFDNLGIVSALYNPKIKFNYYDSVYDKLRRDELRFTDSLCRTLNTDPEYKEYIKGELFYLNIERKFEPYFIKKYRSFVHQIPECYVDKLTSYKKWINNDKYIPLLYYRFFCHFYNLFALRDSINSSKLAFYEYNNIQRLYTKRTKDYLLFKLVKDNINRGPGFEKYLKKFKSDCKNLYYKEYIDSLTTRFYGMVSNDNVLSSGLLSSTGQSISWRDLLSRNKGSVLYIDFWASWCIPCRMEIPYSIKLQKKINDEELTFAYISIDKDSDKWLKAINDLHLINTGQHYLLKNIKSSPLSKFIGIPPIPHYLIINKRGEVISMNAPRPSDPKSEKILLKLLE